jgi:hypothetical protein
MLDFKQWIKRHEGFIDRMKRVPGVVELRYCSVDKAASLPTDHIDTQLVIPDVLLPLLEEEHEPYCCLYYWYIAPKRRSIADELWGGGGERIYGCANLTDITSVPEMVAGCRDWSRDWNEPDATLWGRAFPWVAVGNGDYLGLDVQSNVADPPVVYLDHDGGGGSCILAPCLEEFLYVWERLAYIGPIIGKLAPFRDSKTGYLSCKGAKCKDLNRLFEPALQVLE